jgi:ABC-type phosphate transport system permease subunit
MRFKINGEQVAKGLLTVVAFSALASLLLIAVFIFKEGLPFMFKVGLRDFLFSSDWNPQAGKFGIFSMIVSSLYVTLGAMLIGAPLGIAGAIFLNEFLPRRVMRIIKPTIELLAGIPSVVFGFLGVMVLAPFIREYMGGPGLSILAASIILGIMILPTVISISTDAIAAVPNSYREGGAGTRRDPVAERPHGHLESGAFRYHRQCDSGHGTLLGRDHGGDHGGGQHGPNPPLADRSGTNPHSQYRAGDVQRDRPGA